MSGAVVVATVSLATRRRWREIVPVAVVGFLASVVFFETHPGAEDSWLFSLLFTIVFVTGVIAPGMYIGARRDLRATLQERAERVEREQELRIVQAQVIERARIAREMHDVLAHRLSLVALHAGALEYCRGLTRRRGGRGSRHHPQDAHQALEDLHEILGVLRTVDPTATPEPPQPTLVDLPSLVEEAQGAGTRVRLHNGIDDLAEAPEAVGRSVYRMVQESLTNARKHAPDTTVDVTLSGGPGGGLGLEVRNPIRVGAAASATPGSGLGLIGLDRARRADRWPPRARGIRRRLRGPSLVAVAGSERAAPRRDRRRRRARAFRALDDPAQRRRPIELVGEADDGEAGLELIARVSPDVVLMDIRMPRHGRPRGAHAAR